MPKYESRITVVEAWKFSAKDIGACPEWVKHSDVMVMPPIGKLTGGIPYIEVDSVLGTQTAFEGDYVVKNEDDEVYVIDSAVFNLYYEKRDPPAAFDLEKALAGEPVKLRNGCKAYVLADLRSIYRKIADKRCLIGTYVIEFDREAFCNSLRWKCSGAYYANINQSAYDIIGMWENNEGANND